MEDAQEKHRIRAENVEFEHIGLDNHKNNHWIMTSSMHPESMSDVGCTNHPDGSGSP